MTLEWIALVVWSAVSAATLLISVALFRKVRRIDMKVWALHEELPRQIREAYRQGEALEAVYRLLSFRHPLPQTREWAVSPDALRILVEHALAARPKRILECGSGVSTVALARCMELNGAGHVYSLEHDIEYANKTRAYLARVGLSPWATVIDAPLGPLTLRGREWLWYQMGKCAIEEIDMLFVDGPPTSVHETARYPAGPILFPRLSRSAVAFLDDEIRPEEKQAIRMWKEDFPQLVSEIHKCEKGLARLTLTHD